MKTPEQIDEELRKNSKTEARKLMATVEQAIEKCHSKSYGRIPVYFNKLIDKFTRLGVCELLDADGWQGEWALGVTHTLFIEPKRK